MTKLSLPIWIVCLLGLGGLVSCNRSNVQIPQPSIVGKWAMKSAITNTTTQGVNYKDTALYTSADYFDFKADGTLSIFASGVAYNGNWQINSSNKLLITNTNYMDFVPSGFDIPMLTQHDLQIYDMDTTPPQAHLKKNLI